MSKAFTIFLGAREVLGSLGVMAGVLTQWAALRLILTGLRAFGKKSSNGARDSGAKKPLVGTTT